MVNSSVHNASFVMESPKCINITFAYQNKASGIKDKSAPAPKPPQRTAIRTLGADVVSCNRSQSHNCGQFTACILHIGVQTRNTGKCSSWTWRVAFSLFRTQTWSIWIKLDAEMVVQSSSDMYFTSASAWIEFSMVEQLIWEIWRSENVKLQEQSSWILIARFLPICSLVFK